METLNIIVPIIAGLLGGLIGIYLQGRITRDVKIMLAFSGSYLFGLTILHLFPELFHHHDIEIGYYVLLGFLAQLILDVFSKGVEHGHIHKSDQKAKSFPYGIFIALFIHSFIEGLPLSGGAQIMHADHSHLNSGSLLVGIAIHKIPEAIGPCCTHFSFLLINA